MFTQPPPPAYNEGLHHSNVIQPLEYPDEEKKLPYPQISYNPAYPSAPPPAGPTDYQGYPPPTHPGTYITYLLL